MQEPLTVAVIGSGISGLIAAWSLQNKGCQVVLIEKKGDIGFSFHSAEPDFESKRAQLDIPLRMLNSQQWPLLSQIYKQLNIETTGVDSSQSFCDENQKAYLNIGAGGLFDKGLFQLAKRLPRKILTEMFRLRDKGQADLSAGLNASQSFRNYLDASDYSEEFLELFLYPILSSTVCTCSFRAIDHYPAQLMLQALSRITYLAPGSAQYLMRTRFGSGHVVSRLRKTITSIHQNQEVTGVAENESGVVVSLVGGKTFDRAFDHVVVATQANQAAEICGPRWASVLNQFEYETVEVCLHRDTRLLPTKQSDWATFNFMTTGNSACCSVSMQKFYDDLTIPVDLFQTINPIFPPKKMVARRLLQRPVVTTKSFRLWREIGELHRAGQTRIWVSGSYAQPGIPLLESGVASSLEVSDLISSCGDKLLVKH